MLGFLGCVASVAQDRIPKIREFDLKTTELLGRLLFEYDVAAARATDAVFEQNFDLSSYPVRGWIVTEDNDGFLVAFIGEHTDGYRAIFDVRLSSSGEAEVHFANNRSLSHEELSQFRARQLTRPRISEYCSDRYNSVVLKDPAGAAWLVYWIAATTDPDLIPVGGHYRFTVSMDGLTIQSADRLSRSCLNLDKKDIPKETSLAALFVTHIVSSTPLETHVFLGLLHQVDFMVGITPDTMWSVTKGKVLRIEE